jgi:hypothetical protein
LGMSGHDTNVRCTFPDCKVRYCQVMVSCCGVQSQAIPSMKSSFHLSQEPTRVLHRRHFQRVDALKCPRSSTWGSPSLLRVRVKVGAGRIGRRFSRDHLTMTAWCFASLDSATFWESPKPAHCISISLFPPGSLKFGNILKQVVRDRLRRKTQPRRRRQAFASSDHWCFPRKKHNCRLRKLVLFEIDWWNRPTCNQDLGRVAPAIAPSPSQWPPLSPSSRRSSP